MQRILITGANSFVGKNYILWSKYKRVEEVSLLDKKPDEIDFSKYDVVINLIAVVHQSGNVPESEYFKINKDLCLNIAECAKRAGVKQFVFLSTVKVYGETTNNSIALNEDSPCYPHDSYGRSKLAAETALKQLDNFGFTVSIIRTPLVYGDGVKANMLNIMKLVDRLPILPLGGIHNKRSFTFVGNLVAFIDRIIEKRASGVFISEDLNPLSTSELVILISKGFNKKLKLFRLPSFIIGIANLIFPGMISRLFTSLEINNQKTLKLLDFTPPYSSEEGIRIMVDAYQKSKPVKPDRLY